MEISDTKQLTLESFFIDAKPLEVELGCGKSRFIITRAIENFGSNFIAIDRAGRFMKAGILKAEKHLLNNIRFFKCNAQDFVVDVLPDNSVDIFHVYHPDPWPKSKQRKRRLIQSEFLNILSKKCKVNGQLFISTDHTDYLKHMLREIKTTHSWKLIRESTNQRLFQEHLKTNYQMKYEKQGKDIHYLELVKNIQSDIVPLTS